MFFCHSTIYICFPAAIHPHAVSREPLQPCRFQQLDIDSLGYICLDFLFHQNS